jgi:hypothetical protein
MPASHVNVVLVHGTWADAPKLLLLHGRFALESHAGEIATAIREFLTRPAPTPTGGV